MAEHEELNNNQNTVEEDVSWEEIKQDFVDAFKTIGGALFSPPKAKMKWAEFLQDLSNAIDEEAVDYQKKSGKTFLGGKCTIYGEKSGMKTILKISAEEYFQNTTTEKIEHRTVIRECSYAQFDMNDAETKRTLGDVLREPCLMNIDVPEQQE